MFCCNKSKRSIETYMTPDQAAFLWFLHAPAIGSGEDAETVVSEAEPAEAMLVILWEELELPTAPDTQYLRTSGGSASIFRRTW